VRSVSRIGATVKSAARSIAGGSELPRHNDRKARRRAAHRPPSWS